LDVGGSAAKATNVVASYLSPTYNEFFHSFSTHSTFLGDCQKYMTRFNPCKDRNACTENGMMCNGCGRTHVEIARTRAIVADVVSFLSTMHYENPEEFMAYLTRKVLKKVKIAENIS